MAEKKQKKQFNKEGLDVELGYKQGLERRIHYTLSGKDSSKDLLVFVHGSPGSSSNFIGFAKDSLLLEKYQILLIDRPGFGYSSFGNSEPDMQKQAAILNQVVKQFKSKDKILIGHSLGGPIIVRMAMDTSFNYKGLMLVAASVSPELEPKEKWRKPMNWKIIRWLIPRSFRVSNQEILPAKDELEVMEPLWTNITSQVCIIQGEKDKLVPAGNADYAEKMLVNASKLKVMKFEKFNHFIPFTEPEIMIEELLTFFD
ncbi:MAG: alpha/beta hydrolase [Bacteroidia bacterium]